MNEPRKASGIPYLYAFCNDVAAMRDFYVDLLGLEATAFHDDTSFGWLALQAGTLQLMFFRWGDGALPVETRWAAQPGEGWEPSAALVSWSVEVGLDRLARIVREAPARGVVCRTASPTWRQDSYWGLTVLDPMGNTVEVFAHATSRPPAGATPRWEDVRP